MIIDEIREQIAISLDLHCDENWFSILDDTSPGHYGVEDLECQLAIEDIWVDMRKKTFSFKNAALSFSARLLSSREEDGVDMPFRKDVSGLGTWEFKDAKNVKIVDFKINETIDFFEVERV